MKVRTRKLTRYGHSSALVVVEIPFNFFLDFDRAIKVANPFGIFVGNIVLGSSLSTRAVDAELQNLENGQIVTFQMSCISRKSTLNALQSRLKRPCIQSFTHCGFSGKARSTGGSLTRKYLSMKHTIFANLALPENLELSHHHFAPAACLHQHLNV